MGVGGWHMLLGSALTQGNLAGQDVPDCPDWKGSGHLSCCGEG